MKREKMVAFYQRYKHAVPLLMYMVLYMTWWTALELKNDRQFQVIHMPIDDYIPFCEVFVIPYFLWFLYVSATVVFFFFKDKEEYFQCIRFLFTGMTIFLIISTFLPNGHHLRLTEMPRDNIFTRMVAGLWSTDTPTNLWPSIHVYNSMGAHFAIMKSKTFEHRFFVKFASFSLAVSIILSTMFIKQHSMFDVLTALVMGAVMYLFVYRRDFLAVVKTRIKLSFIS